VINRKRQSIHPYGQPGVSPERKKSSSNLGSAFGRFGRKESHQNLDSQLSPTTTLQRPSSGPSQSPRASDAAPSSLVERQLSLDHLNGTVPGTNGDTISGGGLVNGANSSSDVPKSLTSPLEVFLCPANVSQNANCSFQPKKDADGFTVPTASSDPIQQALNEAAQFVKPSLT
jgi:hypothetical protein